MIKTTLPRFLAQLDQERQKVFYQLKNFKKDFILAGGTAIMLQIGHRLSYDFDLFTDKEIDERILKKVKSVFGGQVSLDIVSNEIVFVKTGNNIDIHLVLHPFKTLKEPIVTSAINIFHLDDLAANKAYVLGRRAVWRDYVDLFFLLKWNYYRLDAIIALAKRKFNYDFNEKLFLEQLVYFKDVNVVDLVFLQERYLPSQIKSFLEKEVKKYLKRVL